MRHQLVMAAEGTGQKVLAHGKFKNMTTLVPRCDEQQKIGSFFRTLDHLITLHQRKQVEKTCRDQLSPDNDRMTKSTS